MDQITVVIKVIDSNLLTLVVDVDNFIDLKEKLLVRGKNAEIVRINMCSDEKGLVHLLYEIVILD